MISWFNPIIQIEIQNQSAWAPLLAKYFCATSNNGVDLTHRVAKGVGWQSTMMTDWFGVRWRPCSHNNRDGTSSREESFGVMCFNFDSFWPNFWCEIESKSSQNQIASLQRNCLRSWFFQNFALLTLSILSDMSFGGKVHFWVFASVISRISWFVGNGKKKKPNGWMEGYDDDARVR